MAIIRFIALLLIIVAFVGVIVFGMTLIQKSGTEKKFAIQYIILLFSAFLIGAIIRQIQQYTGNDLLDGFVPIFGGLYLSLMGVPMLVGRAPNQSILKKILFLLLGLFVTFLGLGVTYLGITQVWKTLS